MERVVCLIVGYVFGLFQTAVLYGKMKGVDIRSVGSKNAGTTNTLRVMGAKAGLIVLFGDMFKCILAIIVTYFLFGRSNPDYRYFYMIYTAAGAVYSDIFSRFTLSLRAERELPAPRDISFPWDGSLFLLDLLLSLALLTLHISCHSAVSAFMHVFLCSMLYSDRWDFSEIFRRVHLMRCM